MKKILYSLLTFIGIGILAGILYILITSQWKDIGINYDPTPILPSDLAHS